MGVGAGLYMCDVVKKKFTFAISSPDEFLLDIGPSQIPPVTKMAAIWKMVAVDYLKFFDIVG